MGASQPWERGEAVLAVAGWLRSTDDRRYVAYLEASRADPSLPGVNVLQRLFGGWKGTLSAAEGMPGHAPWADVKRLRRRVDARSA